MMRLVVALVVSLVSACGGDGHEPSSVTADVIATIQRASDPSGTARSAFIPELSPVGFPLASQGAYKADRPVRLQQIDGRVVVSLSVRKRDSEDRFRFVCWLERRPTGWLIAGWDPSLRAESASEFRVNDILSVPAKLGASGLRRSIDWVIIPRRQTPEQRRTDNSMDLSKIFIRARARNPNSACRGAPLPRATKRRILEASRSCFSRLDTDRPPRGRIIFRTTGEKSQILESTIAVPEFTDCIKVSVERGSARDDGCTFDLDVFFGEKTE